MFDPAAATLPILGQAAAPSPFMRRIDELRRTLLPLDEAAAAGRFDLGRYDRVLKSTISLCPHCLEHVAALVYSLDGRVWMQKRCPQHGFTSAVIENDERFYFLSNKDNSGRRYAADRVLEFPAYDGGCCGTGANGTVANGKGANGTGANGTGGNCQTAAEPAAARSDSADHDFTNQWGNKSCTVLVEITNACNLSCKVCYSDARGDRVMPLNVFQRYIRRLCEQKGGLDSVQLTGGEAILHPQFWEIVAWLHRQDEVRKIYLPTNGILFARPENAARLVPFRDKLMLLLQFDGRKTETNLSLRSANPTKIRQTVIEQLAAAGVIMQLTMTVTKGVNDDEIGWVIDTAMRHAHVKVVALQPVTYSGRYELGRDAVDRLTLSDVVKAVVKQAAVRMGGDDFVPIPCSHPNCGWLTLFIRRFGLRLNIARHVDLAAVINQAAYKTILSQREIRELVGSAQPALWSRIVSAIGRRIVRPTDLVGIAVKPFMDCFNYDQDRIANCCHHLLDTRGEPTSFCEYNARLRPADSWDVYPLLGNV